MDCSRLIPVFCFDNREEQFFISKFEYLKYQDEIIEQVANLRLQLQHNGSNLLIVHGSCDVLIPSLARVLNVDEVISNDTLNLSPGGALCDFKKGKALEIQYLLKMHSISMKMENQLVYSPFFAESIQLPPFPEINIGKVPVKENKERIGF